MREFVILLSLALVIEFVFFFEFEPFVNRAPWNNDLNRSGVNQDENQSYRNSILFPNAVCDDKQNRLQISNDD